MKQTIKITIVAFLFCVVVFGLAKTAWAADPGPNEIKCADGTIIKVSETCVLSNPAPGYLVNINNFGDLIKRIINDFLFFAGAIAVVFLLIGGYQYIASRGNEEAMEAAKKTITSAVIGIIIIVLAFAIVSIVNTLLTQPPTRPSQGGNTGFDSSQIFTKI